MGEAALTNNAPFVEGCTWFAWPTTIQADQVDVALMQTFNVPVRR